jgi:hypothetical protein
MARGMRAIIAMRVEEGCEQAWSELANRFGVGPLFPESDPSSATARLAVRGVINDLASELSTLALAAYLLPPVTRRPPSSTPTPSKVITLRAHAKRDRPGAVPVLLPQ